jgi:hypothetical protein
MSNQLINNSLPKNNFVGVTRMAGNLDSNRLAGVSTMGSNLAGDLAFPTGAGFQYISGQGVSGVQQQVELINSNLGDPNKMGVIGQVSNRVEPIDIGYGSTSAAFIRDIHGNIVSQSDGSIISNTGLDPYVALSTTGRDNQSFIGYGASGQYSYFAGANVINLNMRS